VTSQYCLGGKQVLGGLPTKASNALIKRLVRKLLLDVWNPGAPLRDNRGLSAIFANFS